MLRITRYVNAAWASIKKDLVHRLLPFVLHSGGSSSYKKIAERRSRVDTLCPPSLSASRCARWLNVA